MEDVRDFHPPSNRWCQRVFYREEEDGEGGVLFNGSGQQMVWEVSVKPDKW